MKTLLFTLLLLAPSILQAQTDSTAKSDRIVYTLVQKQPEFPGGMQKLGNYIEKNLQYPEAARKAKVQGRVFVRFVITDEGRIEDVNILKGIGFGADQEAVRLVKNMPNWIPAQQDGKPVNVYYNIPINFILN